MSCLSRVIVPLIFIVMIALPGSTQIDPDSTNFIPPVNHPMKLAGSFGELRKNHFHAGIDIKSSKGQEGDPIVASEAGHVSRIKIESSGYGRAVYVDHPNGYTTVYAHLRTFSKALENYIEKVQREVQSFEVDIYLPPEKFAVTQGEEIGEMGNTGKSSAPHLHFEIRETLTERPVLPSKFDIKVTDKIAPVINAVYVYELDNDGNPIKKSQLNIKRDKNQYTCMPSVVNVRSQYVGIGLSAYDRSDGVWNKNGVYDLQITANDSTYFYSAFDVIDFSESKALNAIIDYPHYEKTRTKILKLFNAKCNPLSNYNTVSKHGWLSTETDHTFKVSVGDNSGNKSHFEIAFSRHEDLITEKSEEGRLMHCGMQDTIITSAGSEIVFFDGTLYNDQRIRISEKKSPNYSVRIENENSPPHRSFKLSIPMPIKDSKYCVVKKENGKRKNFGGSLEQDTFVVYLDEFGQFEMYQDLIPPNIVRHATTGSGSNKKYLFKIGDNIDFDSSLGDYPMTVSACGEWVPFSFDLKTDVLTVAVRNLPSGCNSFTVYVSDHVENEAKLKIQI